MITILTILFNKIIKTEKSPEDWSKMITTQIHKKGDTLNAENYRAIALLSIPGKVFCKILMCRYSHISEEYTSDSQFGFRPGKYTIDAIFIVRQIIERAREYQVPLNIHFIDFKAAFDTIWREELWKIMTQIDIPQKYVAIIKNLYNDTNCAIISCNFMYIFRA